MAKSTALCVNSLLSTWVRFSCIVSQMIFMLGKVKEIIFSLAATFGHDHLLRMYII